VKGYYTEHAQSADTWLDSNTKEETAIAESLESVKMAVKETYQLAEAPHIVAVGRLVPGVESVPQWTGKKKLSQLQPQGHEKTPAAMYLFAPAENGLSPVGNYIGELRQERLLNSNADEARREAAHRAPNNDNTAALVKLLLESVKELRNKITEQAEKIAKQDEKIAKQDEKIAKQDEKIAVLQGENEDLRAAVAGYRVALGNIHIRALLDKARKEVYQTLGYTRKQYLCGDLRRACNDSLDVLSEMLKAKQTVNARMLSDVPLLCLFMWKPEGSMDEPIPDGPLTDFQLVAPPPRKRGDTAAHTASKMDMKEALKLLPENDETKKLWTIYNLLVPEAEAGAPTTSAASVGGQFSVLEEVDA